MFNHEPLQKSFDSLLTNATGLTGRLDLISKDVKMLEAKILELGIQFKVCKKVISHQPLEDSEKIIIQSMCLDHSIDAFFADEYLIWKKCTTSQRFRLFYKRQLNCKEAILLNHFDEADLELRDVPLIEAPVPVRLRLCDQLPALINEITDIIRQ